MTNAFSTVNSRAGIVAKAAAKMFSDELHFGKAVAKADKKDYQGKNGYSAGSTIYINQPARFTAQNTFDITSNLQSVTETAVPLTLNIISTVGLAIDSLDFASNIELKYLLERVVHPAVQTIAHDAESQMLTQAIKATFNCGGTEGSTTFDTATVLNAKAITNKYLCPKDKNRYFLHESLAGASAVNARKGLFNDQESLGKMFKSGGVEGRADGFAWMESEMLPTLTNGTETGTVTVTNTVSVQGQATLDITGNSTNTLTAGQVFTVANVYAVHPIEKTVYPFLQQFVVTANATASGGAYSAVPIAPKMYTSGASPAALQNINSFPQSGAAITLRGAASQVIQNNLTFHKNAFRMVSVPLIMPEAVEFAAQETYDGYTVSIVRAFDVLKRQMVTRLDFLGGLAADRPEWAYRIAS